MHRGRYVSRMSRDNWGLNVVRFTRADPPGRAASEPGRRAAYGASLQQFDELLRAAAVAGHASRPLPLFYALSQAGRALAAAYGDSWMVGSHGLAEDRSVSGEDLLLRRVKRVSGTNDAVSALCEALQAPDPYGSAGQAIEIGAAWAALPQFNTFLPRWEERWRPALRADNKGVPSLSEPPQHLMGLRVISQAPHGLDDLPASAYPSLPPGFTFESAAHRQVGLDDSELRLGDVRWEAHEDTPSVFDLTYSPLGALDRWLLPAAPGSDAAFVPLTAWWVLLFGLSIFARYHPGLWSATLNLDASEYAVPLGMLLDDALETLPRLIAEALSR